MSEPSKPIKTQVREALGLLVFPLRESLGLRDEPRWGRDPLSTRSPMPNLTLYASDETEIGKDCRGRTKQFVVSFKFAFQEVRDPEGTRDNYVAALRTLVEQDIQLNGLVNIVDDEEVEFMSSTLTNPTHVLVVSYRVEYRHLLGDPFTKY